MHAKEDKRTMVLAYGSWGLVAGKTSACKKGNPATIGVVFMRKLSKRFVVAITPEQYTSKSCCVCLSSCGRWKEVEKEMDERRRTRKRRFEIRGLRRCQNEDCLLPQNRDRMAATNIGTQFKRLFRGEGSIRCMTEEEKEFNRLRCMQCDA